MMITRSTFLAAALVALAWAVALPAIAAERRAYDPAALAAEQAAGKSIVVHVTAPWCPTCKAQKPILDKLTAEPDFKDVVVFDLDFDTGIAGLKALNARSQSTLIVFKGGKETGRSVGDTNADNIATLLKTAL
jgi:thiol-disulfide isomerase/thioredoxin